jgi:hypothetical protein
MDVGDPRSGPSLRRGSSAAQVEPSGPRATRSPRAASALPFALCAGLLVVGALVDATPESASLFGLEGPECPSTHLIGDVGCPGCGLTRGTALLLDGELGAATRLQPAAWVVVALASLGALLHGAVLATGRKSAWIDRLLRSGRVVLVAGLLLAWFLRLA